MGAATTASETGGVTAGVGAGASGERRNGEQGARESQRPDIAKDTSSARRRASVSGERVSQTPRMAYRKNESSILSFTLIRNESELMIYTINE